MGEGGEEVLASLPERVTSFFSGPFIQGLQTPQGYGRDLRNYPVQSLTEAETPSPQPAFLYIPLAGPVRYTLTLSVVGGSEDRAGLSSHDKQGGPRFTGLYTFRVL